MPSYRTSEDPYRSVVKFADQSRDCVLAVVLEVDGSTPRKAGSKAIIDAEGAIHGTIGGGKVEAEVQRRAAETIKTGRPVVLAFNLQSHSVDADDPICGGAMRVLIDPTATQHRAAYAAALRHRRGRGLLLTSVRGQREWDVKVEFLADEAIPAWHGFPSAKTLCAALKHEEPRLVVSESAPDGQRLEVLVEPMIPTPLLLVVGGGHVGQAVAAQAYSIGFDIVVIDDRPEFTCPGLFPSGATIRCGQIGEELAAFPLDGDTYIVIVTRGHQHDADALAACIHQSAAYIGMIGSQRKVAMMREAFVDSQRATSAEFDRVYTPIGLDIGAVTVPEIAASIVAQLIAVRRNRTSPRIPTG